MPLIQCPECNGTLSTTARACPHCGAQIGTSPDSVSPTSSSASIARPIVGIVVVVILAVIAIIMGAAFEVRHLSGEVSAAEAQGYAAFPSIQAIDNASTGIGLLASVVLLVGAVLSYMGHPRGNHTVRVVSYFTLAAAVVFFLWYLIAITGSASWSSVDSDGKGKIIGFIGGSLISGTVRSGVILFLFRKSKWK